MKTLKLYLLLLIFLIVPVFIAQAAGAGGPINCAANPNIYIFKYIDVMGQPTASSTNPAGGQNTPNRQYAPEKWLPCMVTRVLEKIVWPAFGAFAIIMFIWSAVLFFTSQGDPQKLNQARKNVLWGIIGIAVAVIGFSAVSMIRFLLGM